MTASVETAGRPRHAARPSWVRTALGCGALVAVAWSLWGVSTLGDRLVRDAMLFLFVPTGLALAARRDLGWRVDRRTAKAALVLTAAVLPFYVVGSSLSTVHAGYPIGPATVAAGDFLPRAAVLLALVVATETFYRGLLCVGIREVGPVAILVSPALYALQHLGGAPIELLLAAPAAVLFGAADNRTHSIAPSMAAHGTGLLVLEWLTMRPPLVSPDRVAEALQWLPVPV